MFGSKKKHNELLRAKINSLVGENTHIEGDINFSGGLHIVGDVTGKVTSDDINSLLVISENASITVDVQVNHLIVNGQINGDIYVKGKVELFDKALINGDIHYSVIELPVGAEVNGKLIRMDNK